MRADRRAQIPAVTYVDGTAWLQSVTAAEHPLYHRLISRFAAHTGVPVVLNTSFNLASSRSSTAPPKPWPTSWPIDMNALFLGSLLATRPDWDRRSRSVLGS